MRAGQLWRRALHRVQLIAAAFKAASCKQRRWALVQASRFAPPHVHMHEQAGGQPADRLPSACFCARCMPSSTPSVESRSALIWRARSWDCCRSSWTACRQAAGGGGAAGRRARKQAAPRGGWSPAQVRSDQAGRPGRSGQVKRLPTTWPFHHHHLAKKQSNTGTDWEWEEDPIAKKDCGVHCEHLTEAWLYSPCMLQ